MDASKQADSQTVTVTAQQRGEVIAYAVQNTVYNLGANIYEPFISSSIQKWWDPTTHGDWGKNFGGEIMGDVAGNVALIVGETLIPQALHTGMRASRKILHPWMTSVAHWILSDHKNEPDYAAQVDRWCLLQERNAVRGAFTTIVGMAANVLSQKYLFKNDSKSSVIFAGKFASRALTTVLGSSLRLAFPHQFKAIDRTLSKHFFAPLLGDSVEDTTPTGAAYAEKLLGRNIEDVKHGR